MATTALQGEEETEGEDAEAATARRDAAAAAAEAAEAADPDVAAAARAARAVDVYKRALRSLRESQPDAKEERVMLLEAWRAHEAETGGDVAEVEKKMPRRVKRKRPLYTEDGAPAGQEEYYDYIFPEEQGAAPNLKILEAAYAWKKQRTE